MSARDTGGPAFPLPSALVSQMLTVCEILPEESAEKVAEQVGSASSGMTLRDYFAAKALEGDLASQSPETGEWSCNAPQENIDNRCSFYYRMADAMLKARSA